MVDYRICLPNPPYNMSVYKFKGAPNRLIRHVRIHRNTISGTLNMLMWFLIAMFYTFDPWTQPLLHLLGHSFPAKYHPFERYPQCVL